MSRIRSREGERGGVSAVALVSLAGLVGVAGLAVLGVKRTTAIAGLQRDQAQAMYAAESGVVATATFLRTRLAESGNWTEFVSPSNTAPLSPVEIFGNDIAPGQPENPFATTSETRYQVTIYNNRNDPGFAVGEDQDRILIVRSIGRAADGATVILEVELGAGPAGAITAHCVGYAQQGLSALNAGRNDCLTDIDTGVTAEFVPGGP